MTLIPPQFFHLEKSVQCHIFCFFVFCFFFQIKALISAPSTEVAPTEGKKSAEQALPTAAPDAKDSIVAPGPKTDKTNVAQSLVLLGKRNIDKLVFALPLSPDSTLHILFNV